MSASYVVLYVKLNCSHYVCVLLSNLLLRRLLFRYLTHIRVSNMLYK